MASLGGVNILAAPASGAEPSVARLRDHAVAARAEADEALRRAGLVLEEVHDSRSAERASDVLARIWGNPETPFLDPAILVALSHAGNLVALALVDGVPVGAAAGFSGPPGRPFHSHIVGLLPHVVGRGAGRAIKLAQRAWCLERGLDVMTWTYDPLVGRNARFNLRTLGAEAVEYIPDFYGRMVDAVNEGQRSDRILVRWDLTRDVADRRTERRLDAVHVAVADTRSGPTAYVRPPTGARTTLVALPGDVEEVRRTSADLASAWRLTTREALGDLLASGWRLTDITADFEYVLEKEPAR